MTYPCFKLANPCSKLTNCPHSAGGGLHGCLEEGGGMELQYGLVPEQGRDPNVNAAIQMAVVLELWSRWWWSCDGNVVELMVPSPRPTPNRTNPSSGPVVQWTRWIIARWVGKESRTEVMFDRYSTWQTVPKLQNHRHAE